MPRYTTEASLSIFPLPHGAITAANLGYAKVVLEETIAARCGHCRVVVHLQPGAEADAALVREYYGT